MLHGTVAATGGVQWKEVFLEILQNLQENTCTRHFQTPVPRNFQYLSYRTTLVAASDDKQRFNKYWSFLHRKRNSLVLLATCIISSKCEKDLKTVIQHQKHIIHSNKLFIYRSSPPEVLLEKGVLKKLTEIYRKTPMLKCDFNKVA